MYFILELKFYMLYLYFTELEMGDTTPTHGSTDYDYLIKFLTLGK